MPGFAVIVAHGSPGDPPRQQAAMAAFAERVGAHLPGWQVRGATLADRAALPGALGAAPAGVRPQIYPMFMSDGWFVSDLLPKRLAKTGADVSILPPFGLDPDLPALAADWLAAEVRRAGPALSDATLVVAAHGSPNDPRAGQAARRAAGQIAAAARPARWRVCFVDEPPFLAEGLALEGPAVCLPFFATAASHVEEDLPAAVGEAGFTGPVLPPVGLAPFVPRLVARRLGASGSATAAAGSPDPAAPPRNP